jgi:hypothetical protein
MTELYLGAKYEKARQDVGLFSFDLDQFTVHETQNRRIPSNITWPINNPV